MLELLLCVPVVLLLWILLRPDTPPEHGMYSNPGRWYLFKYFMFRLLLRRRRKQQDYDHGHQGKTASGYGTKSHDSVEQMERPQVLSDDPMALDAVYMNALSADGTCIVMRLARRNGRRAEIWLSVRLSDGSFYQSPIHPDTSVCNTEPNAFSAAGLRFQCIEPMLKWRVSFNGLLRKGLCNDYADRSGEMVHVAFSFIWHTFTDVFDFDTDVDAGLLAQAVATEPWTKTFWDTLKTKHQTHYEQWGELHGRIKVAGQDVKHCYLRGVRDHSYGIRDWRMFHRYVVLFGYLEDGTAFHVNYLSWTGGLSRFQCGYVSEPNATMVPITSTDINLPSLGEDFNPPNSFTFKFSTGRRLYEALVCCNDCPMYYHEEDWGNVIYENYSNFTVNGIKGWGITEFCYRRHNSTRPFALIESLPLLVEPSILSDRSKSALVLPFSDPACSSSALVGGKGCQLGLLTQLQSQDFIVPSGFCVTLRAFQKQLDFSAEVMNQVKILQDAACGKNDLPLEKACAAVCSAFVNVELIDEIKSEISEELRRQFADSFAENMFAIRSSAAGEDSAEMSAAGQMDTFLGVKGLDMIYKSLIKCWTSQFGYIAVEYRRQHGQPILCGMGVVIQEMIPAEAAGVLFTRDPLTGSPGSMVINANYGLGESVVSGEAEPDQFMVDRTWDDELSIGAKTIGQKKLLMQMTGNGGIEVKDTTFGADTCCLTDKIILELARIGVDLEKRFSDPRDIEFAIKGDSIYLLQARPITSLDMEEEWDLLHEFDSGLSSDREIITTCNIGEMMPSAMTPLTLSTFLRTIDYVSQEMYFRSGATQKPHDFLKFCYSYNNMGFLNMHMATTLNENIGLLMDKRMAELAVMGETRPDFTTEECIQYHGKRNFFSRARIAYNYFAQVRNSSKALVQFDDLLKSYTILGRTWSSPAQLYQCICDEFHNYIECWRMSLLNSASSGSWSAVLMSILSKGEPLWTTEYYSDVAMLLSQCEDVYSADVPSAIQQLVSSIQSSGNADKLLTFSVQEATDWLLSDNSGNAGKSFKEFFSRHGHRCVKEAEFLEKSWQTEPHKVTSVIQAMLANRPTNRQEKKTLSVTESVNQVKSPMTVVGKMIMKAILPKVRKSVGNREWGKSVAVKMTEVFKQAYWKLANMMVQDGLLPRSELLFFLSHREIGQLLESRSGKLVAKAHKRCKLYPKQLAMTYERINRGRPELLINEDEEDFVITSLKIQGMPVSHGVVRGRARVVKSLKDAATIEPGEILIVPFTDVGWSPYFPLISGLVTEIGGLLSHGAVVAREYGLPCVVKVQRATTLFRTGDEVILNGTSGTLEKVDLHDSGSDLSP